jgi:hypothetical protein
MIKIRLLESARLYKRAIWKETSDVLLTNQAKKEKYYVQEICT